ncbi:MAG TPA: histidinol dehydrogenase [Myxococcota bacterium]|nr:histidinol dehydrogenase [Myxococcota bacterium]
MAEALEIALLDSRDAAFPLRFRALEERRSVERAQLQERVAAIIDDVRARGDDAVLDAIERFDGYRLRPDELALEEAEIDAGISQLAREDLAALELAAERVRRFHSLHVPASWRHDAADERLGQLIRPIARAGIYVPGGVAPLASTTLMLGIPAEVAGVPERAMCSPGKVLHPAVVAAARLARVTRVYRVGGVQAIAALAYGTERIARVDKIVGPGTAHTQEAKRQVFGQVAIDSEAGPSEVFIVADANARADFVAADLLAQAEHDVLASVVLATPSAELAGAVRAEIARQLPALSREITARKSLADRSLLIVTRDLEEACALANRYGAEHLELVVADPERWLPRIECAGAIFVGAYSPVPIGDYAAGPSHVLPTGGTARFFSGIGVEDFQHRISLIDLSQAAFGRIAPAAARLARLEGLDAHARALEIRVCEPKEK